MLALGIAVRLAKKSRPAAACVVLEDGSSGPQVVDSFQITSADVELPTMLSELATAARSRAESLGIGAVWVRRADKPPRASNAEGPRLRLLAEGAVIAGVCEVVEAVVIGDGREIGRELGTSKADADAAGEALGVTAEAAAAALAALRRFA